MIECLQGVLYNSTSINVPIIFFRVQNSNFLSHGNLPGVGHVLRGRGSAAAFFRSGVVLRLFMDYVMSMPEQRRGAFMYSGGHIWHQF